MFIAFTAHCSSVLRSVNACIEKHSGKKTLISVKAGEVGSWKFQHNKYVNKKSNSLQHSTQNLKCIKGELFSNSYVTLSDWSLKVSYRFYSSKYIYHRTIQLLPVGHYVSQRVEISGVLNRQVNQWQQSVNGVHISTQTHLGMSLRHQQPVVAETADAIITHYSLLHRALHSVTLCLPHLPSAT